MKKIYLPVEKVRNWVEVEKKEKRWIAHKLGVTTPTVLKCCKENDIKFRWPIEKIRKLVEIDGLKHWEVGDALGIDRKYVSDLCKKNGIKSQRRGPRSGENHPDWKGGVTIIGGYRHIYNPNHPHRGSKPYVLEHHLVMEEHLGRYLTRKEVVHHINGEILDNRLENLELFESNGEHLSASLKGNCPKWSEVGKAALRQHIRSKANNPESVKFDVLLRQQTTDR